MLRRTSMASKKTTRARTTAAASASASDSNRTSSSVDEMLLAALERGDDTLQTGRYLATFKEGAVEQGTKSLAASMRVADARDFKGQSMALADVGDAEAVT